jgi:hypothetical protein
MAESKALEERKAQEEKEPKLKVIQEEECCDPFCGPTTCEPSAEVKAEEEPKKKSGCGPSTCG